jgi:hypothetical protein
LVSKQELLVNALEHQAQLRKVHKMQLTVTATE